jgi:lipopolysaccharide assembly outer membrane protein LptD (OstA)
VLVLALAHDEVVPSAAQKANSPTAQPVNAPSKPADSSKPQEVLIRADKMTYDSNTDEVSAEGNVEVSYGDRTLLANKLIYKQNAHIVIAEGNATLREANGTTLSGNRIEITDDMRDGIIESMNVVIAGRGRLASWPESQRWKLRPGDCRRRLHCGHRAGVRRHRRRRWGRRRHGRRRRRLVRAPRGVPAAAQRR